MRFTIPLQSRACFGCTRVRQGKHQFIRHIKSCDLTQAQLVQDEEELAEFAAEEAPDEDEGYADHEEDAPTPSGSHSDDDEVNEQATVQEQEKQEQEQEKQEQ